MVIVSFCDGRRCDGNMIFHYSKPRNQTFLVRLGEHILEGVGAVDSEITGERRRSGVKRQEII